MNIKVFQDRKIEKDYFYNEGSQNENNSTVLTFEIPFGYEDYSKRIVFMTEEGNYWDYIKENSYTIKNNITKYENIEAYLWLTKDDNDFRTETFPLNFYQNENPDELVPTEEQVDGFATIIKILEEKIDEVEALKIDIGDFKKALEDKVDKEDGKGLSTNDFTNELKDKLDKLKNYDDAEIREILDGNLKYVNYKASTGIMTFIKNDESKIEIDLPLELLIEDGRYDETTKQIILTLANGNVINIPLSDLLDDFYGTEKVDELLKEKQDQIDDLKAQNQEQQKELDILYNDLVPGEASGETAVVANGVTGSKVGIDGHGNSYQEVIEEEEGTTVTGEYINVTDVDVNKEHNISIDTNIKQDSREGYNEIDTTEFTEGESNGVKLTKNEDGTVVLNGTSTGDTLFRILRTEKSILATGTEKVVLNQISGTVSGTVQFVAQDTNFGNAAVSRIGNATTQGTLIKDVTYNIFAITVASGTVCNNLKLGLVISSGKTEYEQYGSMPSIKFPSEIKTPVGKQSFVAGNKNLNSSWEIGDILSSTGELSNTNSCVRSADFIKLLPNTEYIVSREVLVNGKFRFYDKDKNYLGFKDKYNNTLGSNLIMPITTLDNCHYVKIVIDKKDLDYKLQLELGNTATDYIEHQSQVQDLDLTSELLGKIVDKEDGAYFENKYKKYVFTGDEDIVKLATSDYAYRFRILGVGEDSVTNGKILSNAFKFKQEHYTNNSFNVDTIDEDLIHLRDVNNGIGIWVKRRQGIVTAEDLKTYFKENNIYCIYPLATPTYTKLTETQQEQWNAIKAMSLYESTTNLYTISEEGIAPIIDLNYNHVTPAPSVNRESDIEVVEAYNEFDKNNANTLNAVINTGSNSITSSANGKCVYIKCEKNKAYTVSKKSSQRFVVGTTEEIPSIGTSVLNPITGNTDTKIKITTTATSKYLVVYYFLNGTDTVTEQEVLDTLLIYKGTKDLPYLPYGHIGLVQRGKNLFDKDKIEIGKSWNKKEDVSRASSNYFKRSTDVTILFANITGFNFARIVLTDETKSINSVFKSFTTDGNITLPSSHLPNFTHYIIEYEKTGISESDFENVETQIEEGTVATEYEPYHYNLIPINLNGNSIAKVGDIKDILNIGVDGSCKLTKKVNGLEIDDTLEFNATVSDIGNDIYRFLLTTKKLIEKQGDNYVASTENGLCTHLKYVQIFSALQEEHTYITKQNLYVFLKGVSTVEEAKTLLNTLKPTWYYPLAETEVIDLPSIEPIELFEGTNIFELVTNLGTTLTAYYKVSSKKQLIENNNRITALEATVSTLLIGG